jgi:hypothetical protein
MTQANLDVQDGDQTDQLIIFNGINGETGEYLQKPLKPEDVRDIARDEFKNEDNRKKLEEIGEKAKDKDKKYFGLPKSVNPGDLAQTGWGIIFPSLEASRTAEIKEKLKSLLDHRKEQVGEEKYKEFKYNESQTAEAFLGLQFAEDGAIADLKKIPYYLLIVGSPEEIPYKFQHALDLTYAVGRIYFEHLDDYERYASNVVNAERGKHSRPRRAVFWSVKNQRDKATKLSTEYLVSPLSEWMESNIENWEVQTFCEQEATKACLKELLGGSKTPAFLFTASHGLGFDKGHEQQLSHQGALLCQDWSGAGSIEPRVYFSADDVKDNDDLRGLIAFHFACHSVGTPQLDYLARYQPEKPKELAPYPFVARLPQRLLSRGALAIIGHVERISPSSFIGEHGIERLSAFKETLTCLIKNGHPVGSAVESFNLEYSSLTSRVLEKVQDPTTEPSDLSNSYLLLKNTRSYAILGDPAVRLAVSNDPNSEQPINKLENSPLLPSELERSIEESIEEDTAKDIVTRDLVVSERDQPEPDEHIPHQTNHQLIQVLEQFANTVEQATPHELEYLWSTFEDAKKQLCEVEKKLEFLKLKQVKLQLIQSLEEYIDITQTALSDRAKDSPTIAVTIEAATELLNSLKQLS